MTLAELNALKCTDTGNVVTMSTMQHLGSAYYSEMTISEQKSVASQGMLSYLGLLIGARRLPGFDIYILFAFIYKPLINISLTHHLNILHVLLCLTYHSHITHISFLHHEHITHISLTYHSHITHISLTHHSHITHISLTHLL